MRRVLSRTGMAACLFATLAAMPARADTPSQPDEASVRAAHKAAIDEVTSGRRTEANVAWWGFDALDSTRFLQAAMDSGARRVVVPYTGSEWITCPIRLRSNLELALEPGVVLLAKAGEFKGGGDCLLRATDASDITITGYGATLRMRKSDYVTAAYEPAEWRSALDFEGCRRVRIEGLRIESTGGDGIYIGRTEQLPYCEDVTIRDLVSHDNHRQGVSVISAVGLTIENCVFSATSGTAPEAGIDFEPNSEDERFERCIVRNCRLEANDGAGILVYLNKLTRNSRPVDIRFENCYVKGGKDSGIGVGAISDNGPTGTVQFTGCVVEDTAKAGLFLYDKSAQSARVRFERCKWRNIATAGHDQTAKDDGPDAPLLFSLLKPERTHHLGGVDFVDCSVFDLQNRPVLAVEIEDEDARARDIQGDIAVRTPFDIRTEFPPGAANVTLKVSRDVIPASAPLAENQAPKKSE